MREFISAFDVVNEIRMTRSQHTGSFLIVEGKTADLRVFQHFIDPEVCQIIPAHSKENVLDALWILGNDAFAGVLAIVDADFWRLDGVEPANPDLFMTDTHDLETMMLDSPAFDKLLAEYGSVKKLGKFVQTHGTSIRQKLLNVGRPLGYLRWISDQQNLSLVFEDIAFGRFLDRSTLTLNVVGMIRTVRHKSGRHDLQDEDLRKRIDQVTSPSHNLWDVCCGHDLICILSLALRKAVGSNDAREVEPRLLERALRLGYEIAFFSQTRLCQSLKGWEVQNQPFRVFLST